MNLPAKCSGCTFYGQTNDITYCTKGKSDTEAKDCTEVIRESFFEKTRLKERKEIIEVKDIPIQAIKDCLRYCEDKQIYDKLSYYGDFYYKLRSFLKTIE